MKLIDINGYQWGNYIYIYICIYNIYYNNMRPTLGNYFEVGVGYGIFF